MSVTFHAKVTEDSEAANAAAADPKQNLPEEGEIAKSQPTCTFVICKQQQSV